jgi:hypothetical protein
VPLVGMVLGQLAVLINIYFWEARYVAGCAPGRDGPGPAHCSHQHLLLGGQVCCWVCPWWGWSWASSLLSTSTSGRPGTRVFCSLAAKMSPLDVRQCPPILGCAGGSGDWGDDRWKSNVTCGFYKSFLDQIQFSVVVFRPRKRRLKRATALLVGG